MSSTEDAAAGTRDDVDVIVVGAGPAGVCAAVEAARLGARVLVLDESTGKHEPVGVIGREWCYLGGGTDAQVAAGVRDSPREMYAYLLANSCEPDRDLLDIYCQGAPAHHRWLESLGLDVGRGEDGLAVAGNELVWPFRSMARPAARGHRVRSPSRPGWPDGPGVVAHLRDLLEHPGITHLMDTRASAVEVSAAGVRVVHEAAGCAGVSTAPMVVLATGRTGTLALGPDLDLARRSRGQVLHEPLFAWPDVMTSGVLVNRSGVRFVSEDSRGPRLAYLIGMQVGRAAYLVLDAEHAPAPGTPTPPVLGRFSTLEALETAIDAPAGSVTATLARHASAARQGEDPDLHKSPALLAGQAVAPWTVYDLSLDVAPYLETHLGAWRVDPAGRVTTLDDVAVPGVLAAGACTVTLTIDGESHCAGMDLGAATFFGRRAGARSAAAALRLPSDPVPALEDS